MISTSKVSEFDENRQQQQQRGRRRRSRWWVYNGLPWTRRVCIFFYENAHANEFSELNFFCSRCCCCCLRLYVTHKKFGMLRNISCLSYNFSVSRWFFSGSVNFRHALSFRRNETPQQSIVNSVVVVVLFFFSHAMIITVHESLVHILLNVLLFNSLIRSFFLSLQPSAMWLVRSAI